MTISTVVGKIVNRLLQSGESVCPCCRKPYRDHRNRFQKLLSRWIGDRSLDSSLCRCWEQYSAFDFHIDWYDK